MLKKVTYDSLLAQEKSIPINQEFKLVCGIAGFFTNKKIELPILEHMLLRLQHRGPDDFSRYIDYPFIAGMTRLAINGVHDGNQPLFDEQENVVLFYNGEIYNALQLRRALEVKGYRFRTHSDGEVICHLYHEYGDDLFGYLDGMFAIALWVKSERKLVLARDIPGEKPLYYLKQSSGELAFSSEIKSFRHHPYFNLNLNIQALWDFPTFLWIPQPDTVYEEVKALPRGHKLIFMEGHCEIKPYCNPYKFDRLDKLCDKKDLVREVVTEAVSSRLLSEVPMGCFLSGGLDSSIVATLASKEKKLRTYCVAFEDIHDPYHGKANESDEATEYAKMLGTEHTNIPVDAKVFSDLLDDFCWYGDQPFAVSSGLGILAVSKAARNHGVKVLLSGDGADEAFGGYSWYAYLNRVSHNKSNIDSEDIVSFQDVGLSIDSRIKKMQELSCHQLAWAWHYYAHEKDKESLFNAEMVQHVKSSIRFFEAYKPATHWCALDYMQQDHDFYFPNEMLSKLDRMSMAYSIEARAPFASPKVLALAEHLKYSDRVQGDTLKWMLRDAFQEVLPRSVVKREKHGFNVPIDHWLKGPWKHLFEETFSDSSALVKFGLLNKQSRESAFRLLQDKKRLNGHTLFCFIMLNKWLTYEKH